MELHVSACPAEEAGKELARLANGSAGPILLLLSGGSALAILEHARIDGGKLGTATIAVLDERVSADPALNNFAQLMSRTFFADARERGAAAIDTRVLPGETPERHAERFEAALRLWKQKNPDGSVLATMGIGEDGHTAGIMPFPEDREAFAALFEGDRWVVGYDAGEKNAIPLRTTVTNAFLRTEVDAAICYAAGERKRGPLRAALGAEGSLAEIPEDIRRNEGR